MQWFCRHIHKMEQTSVLFRLISILLFGLEIFTSFHTYPRLHGGALGVSALSWHLTNMRDRGRITTRVWNRSRSAPTIVNSAGSEIARFIRDTAVHHPVQSVFLIFHQSELLRTASDNLQQIPARGCPGSRLQLDPQFSFPQSLGESDDEPDMFCTQCRTTMIHHVKVRLLILLYLGLYTRSSMQVFLSATQTLLSAYCSGPEH